MDLTSRAEQAHNARGCSDYSDPKAWECQGANATDQSGCGSVILALELLYIGKSAANYS